MAASGGRYFDRRSKPNAVQVEDLSAAQDVSVFEPKIVNRDSKDSVQEKEDGQARRLLLSNFRKNKFNKNKPDHQNQRDKKSFKPKFKPKAKDKTPGVKSETADEKEEAKEVPVSEEKLMKYYRDEPVNLDFVKSKRGKSLVQVAEKKYEQALRFTAKSEMMLMEDAGFIQAGSGEETSSLTQHQILKNVDLLTKQKVFDLKLDKFGPYRVAFTRNGRYLALAGAHGHVACFDWVPKKLLCEVNVKERCRDITWLHQETMFAVAQRRLYIYDNQGIELHCIKQLDHVERLEFLPYHFLLAAVNSASYLSYLDVSIGKMVANFPTREVGPLTVMCQNPSNAIIHLGHRGGTVTMWSPNVNESLMKVLCHTTPVQSVAVDSSGTYMATSAVDRRLCIWDLRQQSQKLATVHLPCGASSLSYSQRGLLAASFGHMVRVYDPSTLFSSNSSADEAQIVKPYLRHSVVGQIDNVRFCPYEDVMAIGYETGVSTILVPGAGEPNFDALEANPFISRKQRREAEVKMLLDKVQPELIDLDPSRVLEVHRPSLHEREERKRKLLLGKPDALLIEPRQRLRGLPVEKRKRMLKRVGLSKRKEMLSRQKEMLDEQLLKSKTHGEQPDKDDGITSRHKKQLKVRVKEEPKTGIDGVLSRFKKPKK